MPRNRGRWLVVLGVLGLLALLLFAILSRESAEPGTAAGIEIAKPASPPTAVRMASASEPEAPELPPLQMQRATQRANPDAARGLFTGRVLNIGSNQPVAGAELVFSHNGAAETVHTGEGGSFRFEPSSVGAYQLAMVSAEAFFPYAPQWEQSPIEVIARANVQVDGIVVYLTPKLDYSGRVVDVEGAPVAGARIRISKSRDDALAAPSAQLASDADGNFVFNARDFATVSAEHEGQRGFAVLDNGAQVSRRLTVVVGSGPPPVRMRHEPETVAEEDGAASLGGRVIDGSGEAVPAFNVMLIPAEGVRTMAVAQRAVFDGSGEFHFDGLQPGRYRVHVAASGLSMGTAIAVASEGGGDDVTVLLTEGASLRGTVVDAESRAPLELAKVSLESSFGGGPSARPMVVSAVTDEDGVFAIRGLPAGRRSVFVAAANHDSRIVSALDFVDGEAIGPIVVELSPVAEGEEPRLELAGIGAMLGPADTGMEVLGIIDAGGAAEADLRKGDIIVAIDAAKVVDLGWDDSIQRIRGPVGSIVELRIVRGEDESTVTVTRRAIRT